MQGLQMRQEGKASGCAPEEGFDGGLGAPSPSPVLYWLRSPPLGREHYQATFRYVRSSLQSHACQGQCHELLFFVLVWKVRIFSHVAKHFRRTAPS